MHEKSQLVDQTRPLGSIGSRCPDERGAKPQGQLLAWGGGGGGGGGGKGGGEVDGGIKGALQVQEQKLIQDQ